MWQQAMASDGSPVGEPLRVTQGLGIRSAAFSADGSRVAYTRGGRISNVWRVPVLPDRPATWADAVQVTSERAFIEFVDVSPDGAQLALSSDRRGNQDLWLMSTSGGDMTAITADPTPDWAPRWSPSGSEIAFYSYRSGNRDVWVIPARGGPARQLTAHPSQDRNPRWSPDGSRILFHSSRPEGQGWWTVRAAGGDDRFLMTSGDSGDDGGDWSPDGRSLVLSKQARLYQVSVAGREPVTLPTIERPFSPRYSSDGQTVYYGVVTGPRTSHDLWRLSLADRSTRRLTQLENRRGRLGYIFSAGGGDLYFTWAEDDGDIWVMDTAAGGR
jgi:Tol biopolymer transport system component